MKYVALLRGINVGGANLISMAGLREYAESFGLKNVQTYINSGNVIFETDREDVQQLTAEIEQDIRNRFPADIKILVLDAAHYQRIVANVPGGWGKREGWKYNTLFLIPPYDVDEVVADIGELKPGIETLDVGEGVLYHSVKFAAFGRSTTGKLASRRCYKQMTVRNWNTTKKLAELLQ